jgi:hypothetical protein
LFPFIWRSGSCFFLVVGVTNLGAGAYILSLPQNLQLFKTLGTVNTTVFASILFFPVLHRPFFFSSSDNTLEQERAWLVIQLMDILPWSMLRR